MSEFQYYEFRAIDRPLDKQAQAALRQITSRAEITATSLVNVYHFGDFKGNPRRLMEQYFDAFVYYANWGTRQLMLRLPRRIIPLSTVQPYLVDNVLEAWESGDHLILEFHSVNEGGDDFYGEEGEWMDELVPLRNDLMQGDLRCLYLGWLSAVYTGDLADEEEEPPVPPGLGHLSESLERLADFIRVDQELIEVAALASPDLQVSGPASEDLEAWVGSLPESEKTQLLVGVIQGDGALLGRNLLQRFRQEQAEKRSAAREISKQPPAPRRTVAELRDDSTNLAEKRERQEAERRAREKERLAREQAEARARYLDSLVGQEKKLWQSIEEAIATKQPRHYDQAVEWLLDLRDLGQRRGTSETFRNQLTQLCETHRNKPSLMGRLAKAGLKP